MKGYKVFNPDWTCKGFQYNVGQVYEMDEKPICCDRGFHFCTKASDCFKYYSFDPDNKVAEVEALGDIDTNNNKDDSKCSTNKIHIIREITWQEVLNLVNLGKGCTGYCNSGYYKSGLCNSGDWNKSSFNNGCFNTIEPTIMIFNKPSEITYQDWVNSDARHLLNQIPKDVVKWIWSDDMTEEEKTAHPEHKTTGGYLKVLDESECNQIWWDGLDNSQKEIIKSMPNFNESIFEEITGIKVDE